jgi:hypothetical protein
MRFLRVLGLLEAVRELETPFRLHEVFARDLEALPLGTLSDQVLKTVLSSKVFLRLEGYSPRSSKPLERPTSQAIPLQL